MAFAYKSNVTAFNLCVCFGALGIHRFYLGKFYSSILTLLGLVGLAVSFLTRQPMQGIVIMFVLWAWLLIDCLLLIFEKMTDGEGVLVTWNPEIGKTAGFWRRFSAQMIDWNFVLLSIMIIAFIIALGLGKGSEFMEVLGDKHSKENDLFYEVVVAIAFCYHCILSAGSRQATFGKRCVGIFVGKDDGSRISIFRSLWRTVAYLFSWITVIGFPLAGLTKENRALHDYLAGTYVIQGKPSDYK